MSRLIKYNLILLVLIQSCSIDRFEKEAEVFTLSMILNYPEYYSLKHAPNVLVRLTNTLNGLYEEKQSDSSGKVIFEDVIQGNYSIQAIVKLSASDALSLGEIILQDQDIVGEKKVNLTYNLPQILLEESSDLGILVLKSSLPGDLLIKEVFYTGTTTPNDKAYWSDHFVEIFNNSDHIIYADSLYIGDLYGANGVSESSHPSVFQEDIDHVYLNYVWMIPGDGNTYPILPGESIIIAQDGLNHRDDPNGNPNSIDLSQADFETFLLREEQRDVDFVGVTNMTEIFAKSAGTFDWILFSSGSSLVIFKVTNQSLIETVPEPESTLGRQVLKIPVAFVLDAFEALANSEAGSFKRIPMALDGGFIYCSGIFNGESCRRKVESNLGGFVKLQDTNNSSLDFEVIAFPSPKVFE